MHPPELPQGARPCRHPERGLLACRAGRAHTPVAVQAARPDAVTAEPRTRPRARASACHGAQGSLPLERWLQRARPRTPGPGSACRLQRPGHGGLRLSGRAEHGPMGDHRWGQPGHWFDLIFKAPLRGRCCHVADKKLRGGSLSDPKPPSTGRVSGDPDAGTWCRYSSSPYSAQRCSNSTRSCTGIAGR